MSAAAEELAGPKFREKKNRPPPLVACASKAEVESAVAVFVRPGDRAVVLGAELGAGGRMRSVAHALARAAGKDAPAVRLLDVLRKAEDGAARAAAGGADDAAARAAAPAAVIAMRELRAPDEWRASFDDGGGCDVLVLDLASVVGLDMVLDTLALSRELLAAARPRCLLVKSAALGPVSYTHLTLPTTPYV